MEPSPQISEMENVGSDQPASSIGFDRVLQKVEDEMNLFRNERVISASTSIASSSTECIPISKKFQNRDWVLSSIVTLVVALLDKAFDLQFIIYLYREQEWAFFGVSLTFLVVSTVLTSLFALQSLWLQSSQVPGWSSFWVKEIQTENIFLHEKLSKPIHLRAMPDNNPFVSQLLAQQANTEKSKGTNLKNEVKQPEANNTETLATSLELHDETSITRTSRRNYINFFKEESRSENVFDDVTNNTKSLRPKFSKNYQFKLKNIDSGDGAQRTTVLLITKQRFRMWVKYLSLAILFTGLLPEFVLVMNLILYWKSKEKRPIVNSLLREAWYVQTLKLSEALLESLPQIHLKMYYFLILSDEQDLSVFVVGHHWYTSNAAGLLVNAASICIGLVSILHIPTHFKLLAFVLLFMNLATRVLVCATFGVVTHNAMYFVPFICSLLLTSGATAFATAVKRGNHRTGVRPLEKYLAYPVMKTFCVPPVDGAGLLVSVVFVVTAGIGTAFSGSYIVQLMVFTSIMGQFIPGVCWRGAGIWDEHRTNKHRSDESGEMNY